MEDHDIDVDISSPTGFFCLISLKYIPQRLEPAKVIKTSRQRGM